MNTRVIQKQRRWQYATLVIARDNRDWNAGVGKFEQCLVCPVDYARMDLAAEEEITAVDYQVCLGSTGVVQHMLEVGEKIRSTTLFVRAWPDWIIKPQVGIGEKDDADSHTAMILYV